MRGSRGRWILASRGEGTLTERFVKRTKPVLLLALLTACHKREVDVSSGVELLCLPLTASVRSGDPLSLEYRWTLHSGAPHPAPGYTAFVHFVDPAGVLLFTDDHALVPAPDTWESGKTYSYRRFLLVPDLPPGKVEIRMGLFSGPNRLHLEGNERGLHEYVAGAIDLLPRNIKSPLLYAEGWYSPEIPPGDPFVKRRWMGKEATVRFRNRRQDAFVFLEAETNYPYPQTPQLTLSVGNFGVTLPIADQRLFFERVRFRAPDLGDGRWVDLRLRLSGSFVPKLVGLGDDTRELALCVHGLRVADSSDVPRSLQEGARDALEIHVPPALSREGGKLAAR